MEEKKEGIMDLAEIRRNMNSKPVVKSSDMNNDMLSEVQDVIISGIDNNSLPSFNVENAAKNIKEALEKKYGPTWQVIIGEGFAYDVTVQNNTLLLMFYNGTMAILVFKS